MTSHVPSDFIDEYGRRIGYCNACGEEALSTDECCMSGEVVPYDDDPEADEW